MTSAWLVARSGLRARWRSWLALALVAGLAGGLVIALAAGARRADAAYPSLEAWSRPPAELIGLDAGKDFASVSATQARTLPQVSAVTSFTGFVTLNPVEIGVMAPADATVPGALWHRKLLAGRLPAPGRADEADISFATAQSLHVGVGDLLPVTFLGASGRPVRAQFRVVGVDAAPSEFPPQYGTAIDIVWTTPAFGQRMSATVTSTRNLALWLRHGPADLPAVEAGISRMAGGKALSEYPLAPQAANTRRSIHLQAVTLWLLAGLLALLGLIITGQLLIRLTAVESAGFPVLAAVGMSPAQLTVAGLARAAIIGAAGAVLALAVALGLSPLFPVGLAAVAELHPGVDADWPALLAGMAAVVAAMVACAAWPARRAATRRAGPAGDQPSLAGQARWSGITRAYHPVALAMGIRLALRRGAGRAAVPVLSTVAAATVGVIGLGVALVFTTSLNHLLATPRLYGVTWDALVVNLQNGPVDSVAAEVARDGGAARWSAAYTGVPVQVNGIQVGVITTSGNPGDTLAAVPARGRPPRGRNEIVLGERTLAAVHARVGATVMVDIPGMGKPAPRTVVGTAVFPAMGDETQLGSGAELTTDGLRDHGPAGRAHPAARRPGRLDAAHHRAPAAYLGTPAAPGDRGTAGDRVHPAPGPGGRGLDGRRAGGARPRRGHPPGDRLRAAGLAGLRRAVRHPA